MMHAISWRFVALPDVAKNSASEQLWTSGEKALQDAVSVLQWGISTMAGLTGMTLVYTESGSHF